MQHEGWKKRELIKWNLFIKGDASIKQCQYTKALSLAIVLY